MKRIAMLSGLLLFGMLLGSFVLCDAQQPGSLVIHDEYVTTDGCLAFLNDARALKKQGVCSFTVIAEGVKLTDLECHAALSGNLAGNVLDTIIDCTYSPVKKLSANPKTPEGKAGTVFLMGEDVALGADGCLAFVNNPGNHDVLGKCGFNVVLLDLAVRGMNFSVTIGGGNTTVDASYAPINPMPVPVKKGKG